MRLKGSVGELTRRGIDLVDRVHDDGKLTKIPFEVYSEDGSYGAFFPGTRMAQKISINPSGDHIELTTIHEIGRCVLDTFREAQAANLPLAELDIHFSGFKIVARELRGGAIVFLTPRNTITPTKQP